MPSGSVGDDGPGWSQTSAGGEQTLGQTILRSLAEQLGGTLSLTTGDGTEITICFPVISLSFIKSFNLA